MKRFLVTFLNLYVLLAAFATMPAGAAVIDFETQAARTGGNLTGIPDSPITAGIATLTGGELRQGEIGLSADQTGVYTSEGLFGSGESNPLKIVFASPVGGFSVLVANGDASQSYLVSDNLGDAVTISLASAQGWGAATFALPGNGLSEVDITSANAGAWNFEIDQVTFTPVTASPEPKPALLLCAGLLLLAAVPRKSFAGTSYKRIALFLFMGAAIAVVAQQAVTEAPAGFTTPTLGQTLVGGGDLTATPGSQSVSNGIVEPPGDTFAHDQAEFERRHDPSTGLGPIFNATSCAECHQNGVTGAASQITELRVGHRDANGNFVNPTVRINGGANTITGRSIVNDRATCAQAQENVPDSEDIHALRAVLNTLGDGFIEAVDDRTLLAIAANQPAQSNGMIHGEAIQVPILEAPGQTGVGRFGWKTQNPTVLSFAADAYLNEMGVTNRLKPLDVTSVCKVISDPEDMPDNIGLADIDHFAQFIRGTQVPPRDTVMAATPDALAGQFLFASVGCATCHVATMTTDRPGTKINGGTYTVPVALGNKIIHPYGDFLLHDVGTGDGIVQAGPPDTANKLRTQPLWGLHIKSRYMHDNASITLNDAIQRHAGEAQGVTSRFNGLSPQQQQQLTTFLHSL